MSYVGLGKFANVVQKSYILNLLSRYFQDYSLDIHKRVLNNFLSMS